MTCYDMYDMIWNDTWVKRMVLFLLFSGDEILIGQVWFGIVQQG